MRRLTIAGNVGQDPEIRETQGGTKVCTLRVATNERVKRGDSWEDETLWVSVPVFGNRAEGIVKVVGKGTAVAATGVLELRTFEKRDGSTGHDVSLRNADVKPLGGSRGGGGGGSGSANEGLPDPAAEFRDDDVPF